MSRSGRWACGAVAGAAVLMAGWAGGCQLAGVIAASEARSGSHTVAAEYAGLMGQSYAVVAWADRSMQSEWTLLVPSVIEGVDGRLAAEGGASHHIPAEEVTDFLANTPQWVAWPRSRLAEELGVDRVVFVEINEFRTNDPGNDYLWNGLAWATLSVIERGEDRTDAAAFRKEIRVTFPDGSGYGPDDLSRLQVASVLRQRLVDRAAWLMYEHVEPNAITY